MYKVYVFRSSEDVVYRLDEGGQVSWGFFPNWENELPEHTGWSLSEQPDQYDLDWKKNRRLQDFLSFIPKIVGPAHN